MENDKKPGRRRWKDLPEEGRNRRIKAVRIILTVIFTVGLVFSGFSLARYYSASVKAESGIEKLRSEMPEVTPRPSPTPTPEPKPTERVYEPSARFESLYAQNSNLAGWITIDGTQIDYPVMMPPEDDDEFYLDHNFDGESDVNGLPFLDARCEIAPKNQVQMIYGHNMNSGIMFHDLTLYEDEAFWEEHQYIIYDTIYDEAVYQIVAAFVYNASYAYSEGFQFNRFTEFSTVTELSTEKRFNAYKEQVLKLSLYDTGLDFGHSDQYLILATCEHNVRNGRFVLLAKQVS